MAEEKLWSALLGSALLCVAWIPTCSANLVFYDGFTIEMPVRFEMRAQLQQPMLVPFKVTGQSNSPTSRPPMGAPPHPVYPATQNPPLDNNQAGYPSISHHVPYPPMNPPERPHLPPHPSTFLPYHQRTTTLYPAYTPTTTTTQLPSVLPLEVEEVEEEKGGEVPEELHGEFAEETAVNPEER